MCMSVRAKQYLVSYKKVIDPLIDEFLAEKEKGLAEHGELPVEIVSHFREIARGGKRLRGFLFVLGYLMGRGEDVPGNFAEVDEKILKLSIFTELFHAALLVQDDVMDRDETRRGVKTVHARYRDTHFGEAMAIAVSDLIFAWSIEVMAEYGVSADFLGKFAKYFEKVVVGQMMDVGNSRSEVDTTKEDIETVMKLKTSEYTCVMPLELGGMLGGMSEEKFRNVRSYGESLGYIFQLTDDLLGIYGDKKIGKPLGSDLIEGKKTLISEYFSENASEEEKKEIVRLVGEASESWEIDIEKVREVFDSVGVSDWARGLIDDKLSQARENLGGLVEGEVCRVFGELLDYIADRSA